MARTKAKTSSPRRDPKGKQERKAERKRKERQETKDEELRVVKERVAGCVAYVKAWKGRGNGSGWKFQKAKQNWLLKNLFDRRLVKKSVFNECAMEYATSVKGNARQRLLEAAQKILIIPLEEQLDELDSSKKGDVERSRKQIRSAFKRAQQLVELLEGGESGETE